METTDLISIVKSYTESDIVNEKSLITEDLGLCSFDMMLIVADVKKQYKTDLKNDDFSLVHTIEDLFNCFAVGG